MGDAALEVRVRKSYPALTLEVEASIPHGITAVFGPSGSGKTTLLNSIAGLVAPDEGSIVLGGRTLFASPGRVDLRPEGRRVGYMFQESLLFPHRSVWQNILFGYDLTPPRQRRISPRRLVRLLGLEALLDRRPANLSTGEAQRVALARALATSPELLLLDEPLASLDLSLRGRILRYLKDVYRELGIPMLYVSHNISEVLAIADRALVISRGRQLAFDHPRKVLLNPFVHSLVEAGSLENLLDVTVSGRRPGDSLVGAALGDSTLWIPAVPPHVVDGDVVSVAIRAGDIIVAVDRPHGISARNILEGRIQSVHRIGGAVMLYADVGAPLLVEITPEALESLDLREGQDVFLVIKSNSIMVLD
ncbi:MAG: molybdenum ABC transporter ATP-binding protein [Dehalococcoidia bacterium]|nr:molybdenum ABC transporter ATP-binding protein [Dehalococcoidia bacterium]